VGARLGVAAADEIINLLRRFRPIDLGVLIGAGRVVSRSGFILRDARGFARVD